MNEYDEKDVSGGLLLLYLVSNCYFSIEKTMKLRHPIQFSEQKPVFKKSLLLVILIIFIDRILSIQ